MDVHYDPTSVESSQCFNGTLTEAAAGKIVLCQRGEVTFVEKANEVARVGGLGIVIMNSERPGITFITNNGLSRRAGPIPRLLLEQG